MGFISEGFGFVLNFLYNLVNNYGVAIIIFSVLLRLLLIPITLKQQKSMKKNAELQEEMKSFKVKYKNNPEEMNKATMELYKREGISPFTGCLSGILQILIILAVFWLVSQPLTYMKKIQNSEIYNEYKTKVEQASEGRSNYIEIAIINAVETDYKEIVNRLEKGEYGENIKLEETVKTEENTTSEETIINEENSNTEQQTNNNENNTSTEYKEEYKTKEELENRKNQLEELRLNMSFLGLDLSKVPSHNLTDWTVYIIPVLYVITSFISIRITTKTQNSKNGELTDQEASMQQMNKSMSFIMPIMSISIAAIAPLGLALYWLVSNLLMIAERLIINKYLSSKEEKENV